MNKKRLYIHTIGCQMNVYDSERIAKVLESLEYKETSEIRQADLIIVNTCAIREKAEQKVFSFLGRLAGMKKRKPHLIIGMGGCVAQQEGEKILARVPHLDVVFGTHAIGRLKRIIAQVELKKCRVVDVEMTTEIEEISPAEAPGINGNVSRYVTIMQGCDNYCAYCVVPYVRGRERSRDPKRIIQEIHRLVAAGVREVTLIGQNVNSYGIKEGLCSFPELLARVNQIEDLWRIRFTTSHPKDLSDELIACFKDLSKLCNHIHLPIQSGSDRILQKMNRKYSREQYLEKVDKLRKACPGIAITSDFIVGFPGETPADFEKTIELIEQVNYDSLFAFKYSDRPNTASTRFSQKIPEQEKKDRLQNLLDTQEKITIKKNRSLEGSIQEVLVEGFSKKQSSFDVDTWRYSADLQWTGRTTTNKIVNFTIDKNRIPSGEVLTGNLVHVRIDKAFSHSLWGKSVKIDPVTIDWKGVESHAA
jgi:tRNA-2-methylthio-N6-dimethylallyladenosine synthase